MPKWKNYRDEKSKEKKEQDLLSEHEKNIALANEHTRLTNENAAMDAARDAAFSSQKAEIDAAASIARSKGHSTDGKVVGMQAISPASGSGWTVPDIGVQEEIEADELVPNKQNINLSHELGDESDGSGSDGNSDSGTGSDSAYIEEQEEDMEL